ncbi:MAG TPA: hypothetical protein O0X51_05975 [Methanocorpusculum sp.]|nr:hypothetical protein [Methanocorpusculum sp.]
MTPRDTASATDPASSGWVNSYMEMEMLVRAFEMTESTTPNEESGEAKSVTDSAVNVLGDMRL